MDLLSYAPRSVLGREPTHNAFVELHNVVAAALDAPGELGRAHLDRITRERGVDLRRQFLGERLGLYERVLDSVLKNGRLDAADRRALAAVAETLALSSPDVQPAHERAFGDAVSAALADDCLDTGERLHLYSLQLGLGLGPVDADSIYGRPARARLLKSVAEALCDGHLSPDEATDLALKADALSVSFSDEIAAMLNTAASRWEAESAPMPSIRTPFPLKEGEVAHADVSPAQWWSKTNDSIQDAMDPDVRSDGNDPNRLGHGRWFPAPRTGRVVLTDRRLVLIEESGTRRTFRLDSVRTAGLYADGFIVRLDGSSKRLVLIVGDDARMLANLLVRASAAHRGVPVVRGWEAQWAKIQPANNARATTRKRSPGFGGLPETSTEALDWSPTGTAAFDGEHLVLSSWAGTHRILLRHLTGVHQNRSEVTATFGAEPAWVLAFDDVLDADAVRDRLAKRL